MDTTPSIFASAQSALQRGYALQDQAASEIVSATLPSTAPDPLNPTDSTTIGPPLSPPAQDPLLSGILDTIRAQTLVSSATALIHAHRRMNDDLLHMLDPAKAH